jgi:hypothetical protein
MVQGIRPEMPRSAMADVGSISRAKSPRRTSGSLSALRLNHALRSTRASVDQARLEPFARRIDECNATAKEPLAAPIYDS